MRRMAITGVLLLFVFGLVSTEAEDEPLQGFTRASSATERDWEAKFRALPSTDNQLEIVAQDECGRGFRVCRRKAYPRFALFPNRAGRSPIRFAGQYYAGPEMRTNNNRGPLREWRNFD